MVAENAIASIGARRNAIVRVILYPLVALPLLTLAETALLLTVGNLFGLDVMEWIVPAAVGLTFGVLVGRIDVRSASTPPLWKVASGWAVVVAVAVVVVAVVIPAGDTFATSLLIEAPSALSFAAAAFGLWFSSAYRI